MLNGVVEKINDGNVDLGFGPEFGLDATHEKVLIGSITFINVAAPNYFKGGNQRKILLEESREYSQIVLRDSATNSDKAAMYVSPYGETWSVGDMATKKELTVAGLGWGRLPEHLIQQELKNGLLEPISVENIPVESTGDMYMFRKREGSRGPVAERFWKEITQAYST